MRVLVLAEAGSSFETQLSPFLATLGAHQDIEVQVRAHPSSGSMAAGSMAAGSSPATLAGCDVALGSSSSALLEALWLQKPIVVIQTAVLDDPAGLVAAGLAAGCRAPEQLPDLCRRLAARGADGASETVWGGAPADPVREVLAAGGINAGGIDAGGIKVR